MYDFYGYIAECRGVAIEKNENWTIDVDKVIETCNNERVKLLIFSNPCNPTSLGLDRAAVRQIISGVSALVVLDEAYMDFWEESMLRRPRNTTTCWCSKPARRRSDWRRCAWASRSAVKN